MFSINVHRMRIEVHARNGSVWLDVVPQGQTGLFPRLTVFIEPENVRALRRELDDIACTLPLTDGNVPDVAPACRL